MYQINHSAQTQIQMISRDRAPQISILPEAMDKMFAYVNLCPQEISWMGHIRQDKNQYILDDVFLLEQEVSAATCSLTEDGLSKFMVNTIREKGVDYYNEIRLWGHSHVDMAASPSPQDKRQILEWKDSDYFIMLILNKRGGLYCEFCDFNHNVSYQNIPVQMYVPDHDEVYQKARQDIESCVREPKPQPHKDIKELRYPRYEQQRMTGVCIRERGPEEFDHFSCGPDTHSMMKASLRRKALPYQKEQVEEPRPLPTLRDAVLEYIRRGGDVDDLALMKFNAGAFDDMNLEEALITFFEAYEELEIDSEDYYSDILIEAGCYSYDEFKKQFDSIIDEFISAQAYLNSNECQSLDGMTIVGSLLEDDAFDDLIEAGSVSAFCSVLESAMRQHGDPSYIPFLKYAEASLNRTCRETGLSQKEVCTLFLSASGCGAFDPEEDDGDDAFDPEEDDENDLIRKGIID